MNAGFSENFGVCSQLEKAPYSRPGLETFSFLRGFPNRKAGLPPGAEAGLMPDAGMA